MDIMYQIVNNIEQRDYIRMYPLWYKELNRNPERYQEFVNEIETIKKQMEDTTPMDVLLCGDVGYGKTEVAFRAIFKAVCANKQVKRQRFSKN